MYILVLTRIFRSDFTRKDYEAETEALKEEEKAREGKAGIVESCNGTIYGYKHEYGEEPHKKAVESFFGVELFQ